MVGLVLFTAILIIFIGCLHIYWAFGGKWGSQGVIPSTKSQQPTFNPGKVLTLIIAFLLLSASLLLMIQGGLLPSFLPDALVRWGCWVCVGVFTLRTIGDFKYVGLFKRVKGTRFATYDQYLFSPLCLWLCLIFNAVLITGD